MNNIQTVPTTETIKKTKPFRISIQGKEEAISIGREVVRALGNPLFIKMLVNEQYDGLLFTPCEEKEPMSVKVSFTQHSPVRIYSKGFVHDVLIRNNMDKSKTHVLYGFYGKYLDNLPAIMFPIPDKTILSNEGDKE